MKAGVEGARDVRGRGLGSFGKGAWLLACCLAILACGGGGSYSGGSTGGGAAAPSITTQPASQTVVAGETATFTVVASGATPLTYQWKRGANPIAGATSSAYTTPATALADDGASFTVAVSNPAGSVTSHAASLKVDPPPAVPTITSFTASQTSLPAGGGAVTLSWDVAGATALSLDQGIGVVAGTSRVVNLAVTTSYTLTASNAAGASTATLTVTVSGAAGTNPPGGYRFAAMVAPVDGEVFQGPNVDLRLIGAGRDMGNFDSNTGPGSGHGQAASLEFFVDGTSVLTVDAAHSEYWVFKGVVNGLALAAGTHEVFARANYTTNPGPSGHVDSPVVTITVQAAPAYAQTIDLAGDLSLAQAAAWVGTANGRIRVNGHGHRIFDAASSSPVNWQYVDFYDLGDRADGFSNGIDIATTGNVAISNCRFDYANPVRLHLAGLATADIRSNLFRSNMREALGQLPSDPAGPPDNLEGSYPVILISGSSTGAKAFAGNNVASGWVDFQGVNHWTVGGDTDADSNVLIGPRVGIFFDYQGASGSSSNIVIRRNYSHHIYYGGWSQGNNLQGGSDVLLLAEHNVLIGSSWTVREMAGVFRYNLVLQAGEDWMWLDTGAYVHHNLFIGGDNNRAGLYNTYGNTGIRIENNTFDGQGGTGQGVDAIYVTGDETVSSNVFLNLPYSPVDLVSGVLNADYNLFWNTSTPFYNDGRAPAHDRHADPLLAGPAAYAYEFDERAVWQRTQSVHGILSDYRVKYAPKAGSPVIGNGDTGISGGAGNFIGAIGDGTHAPDGFGH